MSFSEKEVSEGLLPAAMKALKEHQKQFKEVSEAMKDLKRTGDVAQLQAIWSKVKSEFNNTSRKISEAKDL